VALSDLDRKLIARCLAREPDSWSDFVDRFMGLVIHVINHTSESRGVRISGDDREDLAGEVFYNIVDHDFALLRNFRGESSLATYLTVITRRIVVHELVKHKTHGRLHDGADHKTNGVEAVQRISNRDEVERLLGELEGTEAQVVRMFHLEGKSYQEISHSVGMPENSVGPTLTRARQKMRHAGSDLT